MIKKIINGGGGGGVKHRISKKFLKLLAIPSLRLIKAIC